MKSADIIPFKKPMHLVQIEPLSAVDLVKSLQPQRRKKMEFTLKYVNNRIDYYIQKLSTVKDAAIKMTCEIALAELQNVKELMAKEENLDNPFRDTGF